MVPVTPFSCVELQVTTSVRLLSLPSVGFRVNLCSTFLSASTDLEKCNVHLSGGLLVVLVTYALVFTISGLIKPAPSTIHSMLVMDVLSGLSKEQTTSKGVPVQRKRPFNNRSTYYVMVR